MAGSSVRTLLGLALAVGALVAISAAPAPAGNDAGKYWILVGSDRDGTDRGYSVLQDGSRLTPLLPRSSVLTPVAVSGDGGTVAYREKQGALYVSRADGTGLHRVTKVTPLYETVALSRDGRQLAFSKSDGVWIVGSDGLGLRRIASGGAPSAPSWSPDGQALVFSGTRGVVVRPLRGTPRTLVRKRGAFYERVEWSPNGRWIAYFEACGGPSCGLFVVRPNGAGRKLVYPNRSSSVSGREFAWSPDGGRLAFTTEERQTDVSVASIDRGQTAQLHLGFAHLDALAWSPDGRELALAGHPGDDPYRIDPGQLWVIGSDGRGLQRVTRAGTNTLMGWARLAPQEAPAPALPPSERVLGARTISTRAHVTALAADGSRVAFVTDATATDCAHVSIWKTTHALVRLSPRLSAPCTGDSYVIGSKELALAGDRAAWVLGGGCGNYCEYAVTTAALAQRAPLRLGDESVQNTESITFHLHGHGDLLVFGGLVRIGGGSEDCGNGVKICQTIRGSAVACCAESVSNGLIALREPQAVAVVDPQGNLRRAFPLAQKEVSAARLDGGSLVVAHAGVLEVYDVDTGASKFQRPLPAGYRLVDADGGVAVLKSTGGIVLLRLANGRSYTLPNHARLADLEAPGLYYSYAKGKEGRLVFVSRAEIARRLGGS
jgi:WD40 repeat protein